MGVTDHRKLAMTGKMECSVDWFRYSVPLDLPNVNTVPTGPSFLPSGAELRPLPFYDTALSLEHGRIDWRKDTPRQRKLITFTGSDLTAILVDGVSMLSLLEFALGLPAVRVCRLDFAIDLHDSQGNLKALAETFKAGQSTTNAQAVSVVESVAPGQHSAITVYLGSRSADRFLRVYDKALQSGHEGDWIRIELETKHGTALNLARAMLRHGIIPAGKQAIRNYVLAGVNWFDTATDPATEGVYIDPTRRKLTDTDRWLFEICLPCVEQGLLRQVPNLRAEVQLVLSRTFASTLHGDGFYTGDH